MKELKAYIRRETVPEALRRLQAAGAPGISIVEIHPVGYGYEPNYFESRFEDPYKRYSYLRIVKLEVSVVMRMRPSFSVQYKRHVGQARRVMVLFS